MEEVKKIKWEPINFVFYASFVKWPVLAAIAIELAGRLLLAGFLEDLTPDWVDLSMWTVRIVVFIYIGWRVGKTYGEVPPLGALAGTIAGLIIGLVAALLRFSGGFRVWKLFNLITETTLAAIVGCLAVFLIVYLWDFWPKKFTSNK